MADVWIYHEKLDAYAQVPESAVGQHAMSGWVQRDPPPEPDEEAEEEAQPAKTAAKKTASKSAEPTEGDEK